VGGNIQKNQAKQCQKPKKRVHVGVVKAGEERQDNARKSRQQGNTPKRETGKRFDPVLEGEQRKLGF